MLIHYSKKLIFPLLVCLAPVTRAAVVPVDNAKQLAVDFFKASGQSELASADALDLVYTSGTSSRPLYYVFNARHEQGFIIISADDCATPVLGYSLESRYDASSVPPSMKWMMQGLENEIKAAPQLQKPVASAERVRFVRSAARSSERILLKTPEWRQEAPFNNMIPGRALTGCVGTAMSIIMKYHNYPERGQGSYNGANFDVAYDWDNMRMDNYYYGYSQTEADAVATLVYHAAASIGTQFGYSGSSAYEIKVPAALVNYFGYDPGVSYKKRSEAATQAEFDNLVKTEIIAGRPVLYCGQDVSAGHAFVVDGYDPMSGMIHVNWGWGGADGNNNGGWYASTALNPNVSQQHSFNNLTTIIYNIKPGSGDNSAWSPIHITADSRQAGMGSDLSGDLSAGKSFTVRVGNLRNVSYSDFSGKITVALFSADGKFKSALSKIDGFSLAGMQVYAYTYADFKCQLPDGVDVADGDVIRMATSNDGGSTWLPVAGELITTNEIPAKGAQPKYFSVGLASAAPADVTFKGESNVIHGWNYHFNVTPSHPERDVVTVKANGYVLTPDANYNYTINNVIADQEIAIYVQLASEVKEKRSIWVDEPGTLETLIGEAEAGTIKELSLFGTIDARDFTFIRSSMKLTRLDLSGVLYIAPNGSDQSNAIPREAFNGLWSLKEVILPNNVTRLNNGAFSSCGITKIVIPASVSTYEYNVFLNASDLVDVWVGNATPAYINWCVFSGAPTNRMTLHCPTDASRSQYMSKEYWKDIKNIVTEKIPEQTDVAFAVMEDAEVKYAADTDPGRYEKGKKIIFSAEHIVDNDNRMDVYANSTLLTPDAQGNYSVVLDRNTIVRFDLVEPMSTGSYESPWTITDDGGAIGMLTDAVNVLPGVPFTVRINSFAVTEKVFWAVVLATEDGRIKEFISPIGNWSGNTGRGFKMNVNCLVSDATVREGNLIRLATSYNKKTWVLVNGSNENVVDALPALNNQTPVYNFTFTEGLEEKANLSGIVSTAVRGRDLTFKVTPKTSSHMIDVVVNGDTIVKGGKTFSYSFIAKEDLNFDIDIYPPVTYTEATIVLKEGEHLYLSGFEGITGWGKINYATAQKYSGIKKLKIVGKLDYYDFNFFRDNYNIASSIRLLDLSEATIVRDRDKDESNGLDNWFPREAFYNSAFGGCSVEEIILPETVTQFDDASFRGCSNLKELKLPKNLRNWDSGKYVNANGDVRTNVRGGLNDNVFQGCTSLETIYLPCVPGAGGKVGHWYYSQYHALKTGLADNAKVTVVVEPEYFEAYNTPRVDNGWYADNWSNGWEAGKFNIVGEYPVYSLDFDASRCFVADNSKDVSKAASFLNDNVTLEKSEYKLYIAAKSRVSDNRPEQIDTFDVNLKVKVYDNGALMADDAISEDGSVNIVYYNPNKYADKSGNHNVDVVYLYDVAFNSSSTGLEIVPEEIRNNEVAEGSNATEFERFNAENLTAPVLENVKENSIVRFRVKLNGVDANEVRVVVKLDETTLSADEDGFYSIEVTDSDVAVDVYAVPLNGATINVGEADAIKASEASDVTSIAFAGDIESGKLKELVDEFPSIEQLDLSGLTVALPEGAMAGKETLVNVVLPKSADIEAETFKGCVNLASVEIPECVDHIGENAFSGCSSLTSLRFTDIKSIGENAFDGCTALTTIIFNDATPEAQPAVISSRRALSRAAGYSADAFAGMNPNCIVYLDENVAVPSAEANYVRVRKDAASANGRVYEAVGSISLDFGYDFNALNSFNVLEGNSISMEMPLEPSFGDSNWKPLVLPFAPEKVTNVSGGEMSPFTGDFEKNDNGVYMAATLEDENSDELSLTGSIKANTPYVVSLHHSSSAGIARFVAGKCEIARTPGEIRAKGSRYDLVGTYIRRDLPSSTTCALNAAGSAFAAGPADEATVGVEPFSVYAESPAGDYIAIDLTEKIPSGIHDVYGETGVKVISENGILVIYSDAAADAEVFSADGKLVKALNLTEGRNEVTGLSHGVYIVLGQKVIL